MGADLIIGVDVQSELKPAGELNSAGAILGQLVNLMGQDLYKKNLKETTTYIKVNVEGYSAAAYRFHVRGFHPLRPAFPGSSTNESAHLCSP